MTYAINIDGNIINIIYAIAKYSRENFRGTLGNQKQQKFSSVNFSAFTVCLYAILFDKLLYVC